jgi:hypothetical protein
VNFPAGASWGGLGSVPTRGTRMKKSRVYVIWSRSCLSFSEKTGVTAGPIVGAAGPSFGATT